MKMESTTQPKHFQPGEGKSYKVGRMTMIFKTTAAANWNAYTVCEAIEPPESGAGYHRHPTYDETFIIVEGRYDFRLDGKLLKLGPGDVVFVPRGTPWLCEHWSRSRSSNNHQFARRHLRCHDRRSHDA
jgi:mannose-6-phosphate isomerase-like protein (cupin superfamily)